MPGLSRIPSRAYLWVFFFSCWILGSTAFLIDERSCSDMTQFDASGRVREYGNKFKTVQRALRETELMAGAAKDAIDDITKRRASPFDRLRTEDIAVTLLGIPRRGMIKDPGWKYLAGELLTSLC